MYQPLESATEYQLKMFSHWQFFATLTWDSQREGSARFRERVFGDWIGNFARVVCKVMVPDELPYAVRWEHGEIGGRPHCHALIAGAPPSAVNLSTCFASKNSWKWGIAQVRLYEPKRNAAAYMQKGRFSLEWSQGANAYELKKFNARQVDLLHISRGAMKQMLLSRGVADAGMLATNLILRSS
ncbi:MAG: hypothetical protein QOD99_109 [Chthoniobacter sp.]|jgi:hypothetical protein|nr:hypothetical protein [Chthoniobacter sp.]